MQIYLEIIIGFIVGAFFASSILAMNIALNMTEKVDDLEDTTQMHNQNFVILQEILTGEQE